MIEFSKSVCKRKSLRLLIRILVRDIAETDRPRQCLLYLGPLEKIDRTFLAELIA